MLRYQFTALTLKAFSVSPFTKQIYRRLGNFVGTRRRLNAPVQIYAQRGRLLLDLVQEYDAVQPEDQLLEVGTGWLHWYSIYLRLFYTTRITMLDIWDNRQFAALKASFLKLKSSGLLPKNDFILQNLEKVISASNFDELYHNLGLTYVIEPQGSLQQFPYQSFDGIFSFHVMEHVPVVTTSQLVSDYYRILKPGGISIHQIGIDDHLSHYDRKESPKNYLRFSDQTWKTWFENDVQYINRLQVTDWLNLFQDQGFNLKKIIIETCNIQHLPIHPQYSRYSQEDLACTLLTIVHKKPAETIAN